MGQRIDREQDGPAKAEDYTHIRACGSFVCSSLFGSMAIRIQTSGTVSNLVAQLFSEREASSVRQTQGNEDDRIRQ